MQILFLVLYVAGAVWSYRFFDSYIVVEQDKENKTILSIMAIVWPIVYIVFSIMGIVKLWRNVNGKMPWMQSRKKRR